MSLSPSLVTEVGAVDVDVGVVEVGSVEVGVVEVGVVEVGEIGAWSLVTSRETVRER